MRDEKFISGEVIPKSGVYTVAHPEHRLPEHVTLLEGQRFPECSRCELSVEFQLQRVVPSLQDRREQIILYKLPEIDPERAQAADERNTSPSSGTKKRNSRAKSQRKGGKP